MLYFVMPYAGCETLRDRLAREGSLPIDAALRITRAVATALGYAHRHNVIHRDIKPENILLQEGEPVVADFGVATAISAAGGDNVYITDRGFAVGTPAYMSPEQASAERDLDGRSDLYSLACVLFEMLTGQPPFAGTSPRATMARHAVEPAPLDPLACGPPFRSAVDLALQRALAKAPEERFATMAEFCEALVTPVPAPTPVASSGDNRAIAVLPFVNASADPENEYFSDGMTDELITALTQGRRAAASPRAPRCSRSRICGRMCAPSAPGSTCRRCSRARFARSGNRLRITVQLSSVADGRTLWSERYDREMADVFAIQDEIAQTIVRTLRATLLGDLGDPTPVRYTANVRAYSLYLKGRFWWNRRTQADIKEGIRYFEQAIEEDPGYALAYSGLADSYALDLDYRGAPVMEGMERAKAEARKAIELDETLAEAHTSLGWVTFIYDWDWTGAERRVQPGHPAQPPLLDSPPVALLVPRRHGTVRRGAGRRARRHRPGSGIGLHPAQHGLAPLLRPALRCRAGQSAAGAGHEPDRRRDPPAAGAGLPAAGDVRRGGRLVQGSRWPTRRTMHGALPDWAMSRPGGAGRTRPARS